MDSAFSPERLLEADRGFGSFHSPILVARHLSRVRPMFEAAVKLALERVHEDDVWLVNALETAERINGRELLEWMRMPAGMPEGTPAFLIDERERLLASLRYLDAGDGIHDQDDADLLAARLEDLAAIEQAIWSPSTASGRGSSIPFPQPSLPNKQDPPSGEAVGDDSFPGGRTLLAQLPPDVCLLEYFAVEGRIHVFVAETGRVVSVFGLEIGVKEVRNAIVTAQVGIRMRQNAARYRVLEDDLDIPMPIMDLASLPYLYDRLVAPIAHQLKDKHRLWVVMDACMADLPYEALFFLTKQHSVDTPHFLVEDVAITRLPSLAVLHRIRRIAAAPWKPYVTNVPEQAGGPTGSHLEAQEVGIRLRTPVESGDLAALLANLSVSSWLHVSSHSDVSAHLTHLQGLALANGYLHPANLPRLRLSMAVLSACGTCEGDCVPQAPWAGLCGAFLARGTRTVVASGWPVAVEATRRLMEAFYEALRAGASADMALQSAQLHVMRQYSAHPFFWAAFRLIGDGACSLPPESDTPTNRVHADSPTTAGGKEHP